MAATVWWFYNLKDFIHAVGLAMVSHPIDELGRDNIFFRSSTQSTKEPEIDMSENLFVKLFVALI